MHGQPLIRFSTKSIKLKTHFSSLFKRLALQDGAYGFVISSYEGHNDIRVGYLHYGAT